MMNNFIIRKSNSSDRNFILNSLFKSSRKSVGHLMSDTLFNTKFERLFETIVDSKDTVTLIACNPDDNAEIYSYVICNTVRGMIVSITWMYTKHMFRKQGLINAIMSYIRTEVQNDEPLLMLLKPKFSQYLAKYNLVYVPIVD